MKAFLQRHCEACTSDEAMERTEVERFLADFDGWQLYDADGELRLQKRFSFNDFANALLFTNQIGALAEEENHHPDLLTRWGQVDVTWYTHKVNGVHVNDFICAARTDQLFELFGQ